MRYRNLSELRLFFALCVVLSHAVLLAGLHRYDIIRSIFSSETAVQAFFILSGFLVLGSYERSPSLRDFYKRRLLRIYPAYLIVVLAFLGACLALLAARDIPISVGEVSHYLVANLGLANFLKPTLSGLFTNNIAPEINGALWTIKVEVSFYALVPLIYALGRRTSFRAVALGMIVIGLLWSPFLTFLQQSMSLHLHEALYHQTPGQLQFFGIGALLFDMAHSSGRRLGALAVLCATFVLAVLTGQMRMGVQIVALSALIFGVIHLPQLRSPLEHNDFSYGVYLSHFPIIQILVATTSIDSQPLLFLTLVLLLTFAYAWLSWRYIEQPALRLAKGVKTAGRPEGNVLGIDLHNIRDGGGVSYTTNLLRVFDPQRHGFARIVLFGSQEVLDRLPSAPHIEKRAYRILSRSLPCRLFFLVFLLTSEVRRAGCSLLYSPGGLYFGGFRPFVSISRNMMPFEPGKWAMYRWGPDRIRLVLLRRAHTATFRRTDGMIFLTSFARSVVGGAMREHRGALTMIPHGVNAALFARPASNVLPSSLSTTEAIRLVYPSRLEPYKHQVEVARAVASLRGEFPQISVDLFGPANGSYLKILHGTLSELDPDGAFIRYHGEIPNRDLPNQYAHAHLLVFASSCENLPNTLVEALSFGIPIVTSSVPPIPDVVGDCAQFFQPTDWRSIAAAIRVSIVEWSESLARVERGRNRVHDSSWEICADRTFAFLQAISAHAYTEMTPVADPTPLPVQHSPKH